MEEAVEFVKLIQNQIDLIHVSAGMHNPKYMTVTHPCSFLPPMPNVFLAETVKKANMKIPVVTIGGIQELDGAEKILADGKADVVSIARGFIAEPNLAAKAYSGQGEDVTPCIKCMRCHDSAVFEYRYACSVNPTIGLEHKLPILIQPAGVRRKIIVIGGGPAGMKAALIAAERGHEVILFEKSTTLGGVLKFSDYVSFKYDLKRFKDYLVSQVTKANILVKLNTEATPRILEEENADVIIAALGAEPIVPPIPGVDRKNVLMALQTYGKEEQLGQKIVVVGGGQVGCETALHLAKMGKEVTIVEMQDELAPDASCTHRTELLLELDACKDLQYFTSARCTAITEQSVSYADKAGSEQTIAADTIIIAAGMRAKEQKVAALCALGGRIVPVGDCICVGTVEKAMHSAFYAASQL